MIYDNKCVVTLFESITGSNMTIHHPGQILAVFIRWQRYKWLLALGAGWWLQAATYNCRAGRACS